MDPVLELHADGDRFEVALLDFLDANADGLDPAEHAAIAALELGQRHAGGGGAIPAWEVRRVR